MSSRNPLLEIKEIRQIKRELDVFNFCGLYGNSHMLDKDDLCRPQEGNDKHNYYGYKCKSCDLCADKCDEGIHLGVVSHGTHIADYFDYCGFQGDVSEWIRHGVMFVLEAPGKDKDYLFDDRSSKIWWHLDEFKGEKELGSTSFQNFDRIKTYGPFLFSIAMEYKLANYYITNLIKCEFEKDVSKAAANWMEITKEAKDTCSNEQLLAEIQIIKPKVIFATGNVFKYIMDDTELLSKIKDKNNGVTPEIVKLPHPAYRIPNSFRQALNVGLITKALMKSGVISEEVALQKMADWFKM